jgi:hypothetical protein
MVASSSLRASASFVLLLHALLLLFPNSPPPFASFASPPLFSDRKSDEAVAMAVLVFVLLLLFGIVDVVGAFVASNNNAAHFRFPYNTERWKGVKPSAFLQ